MSEITPEEYVSLASEARKHDAKKRLLRQVEGQIQGSSTAQETIVFGLLDLLLKTADSPLQNENLMVFILQFDRGVPTHRRAEYVQKIAEVARRTYAQMGEPYDHRGVLYRLKATFKLALLAFFRRNRAEFDDLAEELRTTSFKGEYRRRILEEDVTWLTQKKRPFRRRPRLPPWAGNF